MPAGEVRHLAVTLSGDIDGGAAGAPIDRVIDRLPGLDGLHLVSGRVGSIIGARAAA